jgi:hypothetical protein
MMLIDGRFLLFFYVDRQYLFVIFWLESKLLHSSTKVNGTEQKLSVKMSRKIEKIGEEKSESENFTKFRIRETQRDKKCRTDKELGSKLYYYDLNLSSASLFGTYICTPSRQREDPTPAA